MIMGRKLYMFSAECFDGGSDPDDPDSLWLHRGMVLLPDLARRHEVEHALRAVGIYAPRGADKLSWTYVTLPGAGASGPLPWPRARIVDAYGMPIARLVAHAKELKMALTSRKKK